MAEFRISYVDPSPVASGPPPDEAPAEAGPARVLLIDGDELSRRGMASSLSKQGFDIVHARDEQSALPMLVAGALDVVLVDYTSPGVEVLATVARIAPEVPCVVMARAPDREAAVTSFREGALFFFEKPICDPQRFLKALRTLSRQRRVSRGRHASEPEALIVGQAEPIRRLRARIAQVAPSRVTVLVTGESGSGKELVARELHERSGRTGRFVALNMAAIPVNLAESELFGYDRGSHATAFKDKQGAFAQAAGGTLFLDEIGEMGLEVQKKLLRVLEEGRYRTVGGTEQKMSARIVAATNQDLMSAADQGAFRRDLLYRLDTVAVHVPPLRDRVEDVERLAYHLLDRLCQEETRASVELLGPETRIVLERYDWPGNVRQLRAALHSALLASAGQRAIEPDALPDAIRLGSIAVAEPAPQAEPEHGAAADQVVVPDVLAEPRAPAVVAAELAALFELPLPEARKRARAWFDRTYMARRLEDTAGNVSEAARQSGMARANFHRDLRKVGLNPVDFSSES